MRKAFINGKIFTSDVKKPYVEGFICENGIIKEIGSLDNLNLNGCHIIDLKGKTVIPGFVDPHTHGVMLAEYSKKISVLPPKINSIQDLIDEISEAKENIKPGQWITGWGYDEGKLKEKRSPNRYDLDKGSVDIPISIIRTCAHIRVLNSKALELAGITKESISPEGGEIEKDENGEPTGILKETARDLATKVMPIDTQEESVNALLDLGKLLLSQGVVAFTDMGYFEARDPYEICKKAAEKGLKQEIAIYYLWEKYYKDKGFTLHKEDMNRDSQIRIAGLKLIADGSISGKTAWLDQPYLGTDEYGVSVCTDEMLETAIEACKRYSCQLSVHAMGGRAIKRLMDRIYTEDKWNDEPEVPHTRFEHVTEPLEESMIKAIEKNISFVTQPIFFYCEIESYLKNLGKERTKKAYPIKTMLEKGVDVCLSTDAPATSWAVPSDPFPNIKAATTRIAYDGTDCGSDEAIDIETAIRLYTKESAKIAGFKNLGMLAKGYKCSFAVLSDDIFEIPKSSIDIIRVEKTYINGEKVFDGRENV